MSEMIERVALAISGSDDPANILDIHRSRARLAIEAMREPTDRMYVVGERLQPVGISATAIYRTMIDAALK